MQSFPRVAGATLSHQLATVVYRGQRVTPTVGQALGLTVTAGNASRAYGAANPAFTASATGALNGDTFTFGGSTTATASSPVGTYRNRSTSDRGREGGQLQPWPDDNGTDSRRQGHADGDRGNASRAYGAANPAFTTSPAPAHRTATPSASPRARRPWRPRRSAPT